MIIASRVRSIVTQWFTCCCTN